MKSLLFRAAALFSLATIFGSNALADLPVNVIALPTTVHQYSGPGIGPLGIDGNESTAQTGSKFAQNPPTSVIVNSEHRFAVPVTVTNLRVLATAEAEFAGFVVDDQSRAIWMMTKVGTEYTLDGIKWVDLKEALDIDKTRYHLDGEIEEDEDTGNPFIEPFQNIHSRVDVNLSLNLEGVRGIRVIAKSRTHGDYPTNVLSRAAIFEIGVLGIPGTPEEPPNLPPLAAHDYAFSYPSGVLIDVLDNDSDPEGAPLTILSIGEATNGTAELVGQKIRFIPAGSLKVNEGSVSYLVSDGVKTSTGLVTIFDPPDVGKRYAGLLQKPAVDSEPVGMSYILFAAEGSATGSVTGLRSRFPFKGGIGSESPAFIPARVNKTTTIPLRVSAGPRDVAGNPTITFVILSPSGTERWSGIASQSPYNRDNRSPYNGRYSAAADSGDASPSPSVGGLFNLIGSSLGSVRIAGKGGNGRGFSVSTLVLNGDRVPFYAALNSSLNPGSTSGLFDLSTTGPQHVSGSVRWFSPLGAEVRLPVGLDTTYPAIGAKYVQTGAPASMLAFGVGGLGTLAYTQLPPIAAFDLVRQFGAEKLIAGTDPLLALKMLLGNGMFTGRVLLDPAKPRRVFQGVCIQGAGLNYGVGYVLDATQLGRVTLEPQP